MAEKKSATVVDAAKALISTHEHSVRPEDRQVFQSILSTAYRSSRDLEYLREKLSPYSGALKSLGFSCEELACPPPGPADGAFQMELPGQYKVDLLPDLSCGTVDAGRGRKFLVMSWGGRCPGTIVLRQNDAPKCWVEVAQFVDRKEPEGAVTCLLLGPGDPGTPFDVMKKRLAASDRRILRQGQLEARASAGSQKKGGRGNVSGNT